MNRQVAPCGTNSAYRRHRRLNEAPCPPCRAAHSAAALAGNAARRAKRREAQPCGTAGGFRRHLYVGETSCDPCAVAHKQRYRDRIDRKDAEARLNPSPYLRVPNTSATFGERVFSHVDVGHPAGCWEWTGRTGGKGYGYVGRGNRKSGNIAAYRAVWELLIGAFPDGMVFDHLCRNHGCVNPHHGEPVTDLENKRRGYSPAAQHRRRATCLYGHLKDGRSVSNGRPIRYCKTCARAKSNARYHATRQGAAA